MKKVLLLVAFAALTATAANAQWNLKYQGDVEFGYSVGVGTFSTGRVNIHTTHGIRFNEYLFAGFGTGIDIYTSGGASVGLPLYVALKGYYPVTDRISPYIGLDLGGSIGLSEDMYNGFLAVPQIGVALGLNNGNAVTFAFGFTAQKWKVKESGFNFGSYNTNAVTFKVGYQF